MEYFSREGVIQFPLYPHYTRTVTLHSRDTVPIPANRIQLFAAK
jgi:hypothetical protein